MMLLGDRMSEDRTRKNSVVFSKDLSVIQLSNRGRKHDIRHGIRIYETRPFIQRRLVAVEPPSFGGE